MPSTLGRIRRTVADLQVFASPRARKRFLLHVVVATVLLAVVALAIRPYLGLLTDAPALRAYIAGFGILAPLVLIVLQAAQVVLAPIPGQILAVVAGYLFGPWWGTLYNMIGITIGSTIAFWLSRRYGRPYVEEIVHEDTLALFDSIGDDPARLALFVFFLVPGLPDDVICFVGGLTRIPLWQLVAIAIVGRLPAFFLVNVVGDYLGTGRVLEAVVLTVVLALISGFVYRHRDRLIEYFESA